MSKTKDITLDRSPVFMIGMPRSGTSVLSEAISMHEEFGWFSNYLNRFPRLPIFSVLDRLTYIPRLRGKKKQDLSISSFMRRVLPYSSEANTVWGTYCGEMFLKDYLIQTKATEEEKRTMQGYVDFVLRCQGKKKFFTKFTGPPRIEYLKSIFPDAFFIHVTRDPRSVVSSLLNVPFWRNGGGLSEPWWNNGLNEEYLDLWRISGKSPVVLAALQWRKVLEQTWEEKRLLENDKYLEIRYEDFLVDPHGHVREILRKVGLDDSDEVHDYLESIRRLKNMNFKYRESLSEADVLSIERAVSDVAKRSGYVFD